MQLCVVVDVVYRVVPLCVLLVIREALEVGSDVSVDVAVADVVAPVEVVLLLLR